MNERELIYVDDDSDDLLFFEDIARKLNIRTALYQYPQEVMARFESSQPLPDLIFVDLNMPLISGKDLVCNLRKMNVEVPMIILTTTADSFSIPKVRACGANYLITKPTSLEGWETAISHALSIDWKNFDPDVHGFVYDLGKNKSVRPVSE